MSIRFRCEACDCTYELKPQLAGRRVRCKLCGHVQRVAEPIGMPTAPSPYELGPEPLPQSPAAAPVARRQRLRGRMRWAVLEESHVQGLACGLLALGAIDLFLTFSLLKKSPEFFESNPIAHWFFARWNMTGMVLFKFSALALAIAASEILERRRPGLGKVILLIGWAGTAYAIYKGYTLHAGGLPPPAQAAE
jgi:hypothetical protein